MAGRLFTAFAKEVEQGGSWELALTNERLFLFAFGRQTNGDNEPWTLLTNETNYAAFVAAIRWRHEMRDYVMQVQRTWSETNQPMMAPVWLHFPGDPVCAFLATGEDNPACWGAFMFGPDWLAKPITAYGQTSEWVWLPSLPEGKRWVNFFSRASFGRGGLNVTVQTPVSAFPLFYIDTLAAAA